GQEVAQQQPGHVGVEALEEGDAALLRPEHAAEDQRQQPEHDGVVCDQRSGFAHEWCSPCRWRPILPERRAGYAARWFSSRGASMPELADPLKLPCGALLPNRIA